MKIYFIRLETEYGPFFSTKANAVQYVQSKFLIDDDDKNAQHIKDIANGDDPYVNIVAVELDDESVLFDG